MESYGMTTEKVLSLEFSNFAAILQKYSKI